MGNSTSLEEESRGHKKASSSVSKEESRHRHNRWEGENIPQGVSNFEDHVTKSTKSDPVTTPVVATGTVVNQSVARNTSSSSIHHDEYSNNSPEPANRGVATPTRPPFMRKKSAIVLETEHEMDDELDQLRGMKLVSDELGPSLSRVNSGEEIELGESELEETKFDTVISWTQGGTKIYVTGSFFSWRKMVKLSKQDNGEFSTVLKLPRGTHRLRFVVDGDLRCSDYLPTATDSMGNLVNYIEIGDSDTTSPSPSPPSQRPKLTHRHSSFEEAISSDGVKYEKFRDEDALVPEPKLDYGREIPDVFTIPEVMDKFVSSDFVTPPYLPPHLEGVILNSNSTEKDNNSVLPIPNHVVLNHLATTSIKHNVLAVASISRYSRKYVTQVLYVPL